MEKCPLVARVWQQQDVLLQRNNTFVFAEHKQKPLRTRKSVYGTL